MHPARIGLVLLLLLAGCSDYRERRRLESAMSGLGSAIGRSDSVRAVRRLHDPRTFRTLVRADSADPHVVRDLGATLRVREADFVDGVAIAFGDFRHCSGRERVSIRFALNGRDWRFVDVQMPDREPSGGHEDACGHAP
jgi:hypothetical protein